MTARFMRRTSLGTRLGISLAALALAPFAWSSSHQEATGPGDTFGVGCAAASAPSGALPFKNGVRKSSRNYGATFPYLTTPLPGNLNPPAAVGTTYP